MKSDVYFVKVDSHLLEDRVSALKRLLSKVQPFKVYQKDEIIPVKLTIGDSSCIYHLSPELAQTIVSQIKKQDAKPFLFDTSVIYKGQRQNALEHLSLAQNKGFVYSKLGAPFIIADGLFGQDGREFSLNSPHITKIKVPSFVGMLDSLIVLSHVTGHILTGYAAAIKNVAMGMASRPTKQMQHSSLKPHIKSKECTACGLCLVACPVKAISWVREKAYIDQKVCIGCGECICACKFDAIFINWEEDVSLVLKRMVDAVSFILSKFKNKTFFNFAFDITKECDCISTKNEKMVSENLGILASSDILSLEAATLDLIDKNKITNFFSDKKNLSATMLAYAKKIGLGNIDYELIEL